MTNLYNSDCLPVLRLLPSASVDVCVTSPPYNLGGDFHSSSISDGKRRSFGGYNDFDDNMPEQEYQAQQVEVLNELHRVIKPTGWTFYSHKNRIKNGKIISPLEWIWKTNWIVYQDVVVDMRGSTNVDKRRFFPSHEFVFVLSASEGMKLNNEKCLTSVWSFPQINRKDVGHPASFHPKLPMYCLQASTKKGDIVIDPYMGIGTTGKIAESLGLSFIGIERNREYFELAQNALMHETQQAGKHGQLPMQSSFITEVPSDKNGRKDHNG